MQCKRKENNEKIKSQTQKNLELAEIRQNMWRNYRNEEGKGVRCEEKRKVRKIQEAQKTPENPKKIENSRKTGNS